jgi:hypothetical protein
LSLELLAVGFEFKLDFTYCNVCEQSMALRTIDEVVQTTGVGGMDPGQQDLMSIATAATAANAQVGSGSQVGRRLNVMRAASLLSLSESLAAFAGAIQSMEMPEPLWTALAEAPAALELPTVLASNFTKVSQDAKDVAWATHTILSGSASSHLATLDHLSSVLRESSAGLDVLAEPTGVAVMHEVAATMNEMDAKVQQLAERILAAPGSGVQSLRSSVVSAIDAATDQIQTFEAASVPVDGVDAEARFLHPLAAFGRAMTNESQRAPSLPLQAAHLLGLGAKMEDALTEIEASVVQGGAGLEGVVPLTSCSGAQTDSAAVRRALEARGGHYDSICCTVRQSRVLTAAHAHAHGHVHTASSP